MSLFNIFKRKARKSGKVGILMLTHNAPDYVEISVRTVRERTAGVDYELIVVDNASGAETVALLQRLHRQGSIDKIKYMNYNSFFAEGNNIAARMASDAVKYFLLLNSDIEIKDPDWLANLLRQHKRGITSYGMTSSRPKVDGYCLLIDRDLYEANPLDEHHQWWWSVTKQQATLLNQGLSVQGYASHERWIHHFGGKSGDAHLNAKGMDVTQAMEDVWFKGKKAWVIE